VGQAVGRVVATAAMSTGNARLGVRQGQLYAAHSGGELDGKRYR